MLAIQLAVSSSDVKCIPNVIPCRIHHNGPAKVTKRYWAPSKDKDGTQTVYFRGRKLRGRTVQLPVNYQGLVLKNTDKTLLENPPRMLVSQYDDDEDELDLKDQDEIPEPVKILQGVSTFDEFLVWGHDQTPARDDTFVKNIEEWIGFAEAIHGKPQVPAAENNNTTCNSSSNK